MILERKKSLVLFTIVMVATFTFVGMYLFKKPRTHTSQYEHIQLPGPGYEISCAYLPAKESFCPKKSVLVIYLHGLSANCNQAFEVPNKNPFAFAAVNTFPNITFLSCDYGMAGSWCTNADYRDITYSIDGISKRFPFSKIILSGTSMGGCTALAYAASAPKNIRTKIIGVLAMYAAGDLTRLYEETKSIEVREALERAFNGKPDEAREKYLSASLAPNFSIFPHKAKVYVISALKDKVIPPILQDELVTRLKANTIPVQAEILSCYHVEVPQSESFIRGLKFILSSVD